MDKSNLPPEKYLCHFCKERFSNGDELGRHLRRDGIRITCCVCNEDTSCKTIRTHSLIHGDVAPFVCSVCLESFPNGHTLSSHREFHHQKLRCASCGKGHYLEHKHVCSEKQTKKREKLQGQDVADNESASRRSKCEPLASTSRDASSSKHKRQKSRRGNNVQETADDKSPDGGLIISLGRTKRKKVDPLEHDLKLNDTNAPFDKPRDLGKDLASLANRQGTSSLTGTNNDSVLHSPCYTSTIIKSSSRNEPTGHEPEKSGGIATGFNTSSISGFEESATVNRDSVVNDHFYARRNYSEKNATALRTPPLPAVDSDNLWVCDNCCKEFRERNSFFTHINECCAKYI